MLQKLDCLSNRSAAAAGSTISGTLASIRYQSDGFVIGALDSGETVKGYLAVPQLGMSYCLTGKWETHNTWGKQFVFSEYESQLPVTKKAIKTYLITTAKWVGPETADRLLAEFGDIALVVCKQSPDQVAEKIPGITPERAREIQAMLVAAENIEKLQIELSQLFEGVSIPARAIARISELWGKDAPARINTNPYALISQVKGIGFRAADLIATNVGFYPASNFRIRAGICHVLQEQASMNGHVCLPRGFLLDQTTNLLRVVQSALVGDLKAMCSDGELVVEDDHIFLSEYHDAECRIVDKIRTLLVHPVTAVTPDYSTLAADQKEALEQAVTTSMFILTGAPGTGKTYTIKRIISSFKSLNIALAAPTGKAAKRIHEQTGFQAVTIHRLLEPQVIGDSFKFTRNAKNPIDADVIVVDEMSMIDVRLMDKFIDAVKPGTRLILIGDTYQLPSVGPGNILGDLIASSRVPYTELSEIKRQDEGLIIQNCHRIKSGQDIELQNSSARDFFFIRRRDESGIREQLLELVTKRLPASYDVDPLRDIQVITPLRDRGSLSCKSLNEMFQQYFQPGQKSSYHLQPGDKVIQTKNEYESDILNGDIGYIVSVDYSEQTVTVDFENPTRRITLPLKENDLELAYAITCHKFQGSEAKIIVVPIHRSQPPLLMQRNWLYTAISRARDVCVLVGDRRQIPRIISRQDQARRYTRLAERLS